MSSSELNYHILLNSVVLSYRGKSVTLPEDDVRYDMVIEKIKTGALEEIVASIFVDLGKLFDIKNGKVMIKNEDIAHDLSDKIIYCQGRGLPLEPLINFAAKLQRNEDEHVKSALYKFLCMKSHPITNRGTFIAYKGVRKDFLDKHSGKFFNRPGDILEMEKHSADNNPDVSCSTGFHAATYNYAKSWAGSDGHLVEVEIDPEDVASVPNDSSQQKIRCAKYRVIRICKEELEEPYYDAEKLGSFTEKDLTTLVNMRKENKISQKAVGLAMREPKGKSTVGKFERAYNSKKVLFYQDYRDAVEKLALASAK